MKIKKGEILRGLALTDASHDGRAIARHEDFVIFADGGIPGDTADVLITRKKKNFAEGRVTGLQNASPERTEPFCLHFGTCGGCRWQHMSYSQQLAIKQKHVTDVLTRIGKLEYPAPEPILGSPRTTYYRNKLDFAFSSRAWLTKDELDAGLPVVQDVLGFHVSGRFDRILDIKKCWLQDETSNRIRLEVKKFSIDNGYEFFDPVSQEGFMRNLIIRSTSAGTWMVIVIFRRDDQEKRTSLLNHLLASIPEITSLKYVINEKRNDTIYDLEVHHYSGDDHLTEEMEGLKFRIDAKSFFQTNSYQALELYRKVREFARLTGRERVYDLYTGTGTIACFVAKQAAHVTGIEYVPEAIRDAWHNANENNIRNVSFYSGDMKDMLSEEFIRTKGSPDVIITDPPRAGMHPDVVERIAASGASRIVYVSCNPSTQARDLQLLDAAYRIDRVQPVDMFPHTMHVENIVSLGKR